MKSLIVGSAACVGAMLGLVPGVAEASVQEMLNEKRIASSSAAGFRGEIDYSFDSTLNRTIALYRTSLESGNLIKRLFTTPKVHTLVVAYAFDGRTNPAGPDRVRITLLSEEYYADPLDTGRPTLPSHLLVIRVGEMVFRYPIAIAEMVEVSADRAPDRYQLNDVEGHHPRINVSPMSNEVHVQRRATTRIPICEFLILANGRDVRGTVAGLTFDMSDEVLEGLRRFAAEMAPLASAASQAGCGKE